jgi:hypothetical protein
MSFFDPDFFACDRPFSLFRTDLAQSRFFGRRFLALSVPKSSKETTDFTDGTDNKRNLATESSEVTEVGQFVAHLISVISVTSVAQSVLVASDGRAALPLDLRRISATKSTKDTKSHISAYSCDSFNSWFYFILVSCHFCAPDFFAFDRPFCIFLRIQSQRFFCDIDCSPVLQS